MDNGLLNHHLLMSSRLLHLLLRSLLLLLLLLLSLHSLALLFQVVEMGHPFFGFRLNPHDFLVHQLDVLSGTLDLFGIDLRAAHFFRVCTMLEPL